MTRLAAILNLAGFFLVEVLRSHWHVIFAIVSGKALRPAIVKVRMQFNSDWEILLFTQIITLTPGTLSLEISADKRVVYVHIFHVQTTESAVAAITQGFAVRIQKAFGDAVAKRTAPTTTEEKKTNETDKISRFVGFFVLGSCALIAIAIGALGLSSVFLILQLLVITTVLTLWRFSKGPGLADRGIASDLLAMTILSGLALSVVVFGKWDLVDVILVGALLYFVSTIALALSLEITKSRDT